MDTVHKCFHLRFLRQSRHLATISVSIHLQIDHHQPYKANFMYKALSSTQWCTPKSLFTYFNHLVNLPSYLFSCIPLCINQGYTQVISVPHCSPLSMFYSSTLHCTAWTSLPFHSDSKHLFSLCCIVSLIRVQWLEPVPVCFGRKAEKKCGQTAAHCRHTLSHARSHLQCESHQCV